MEGFFFFPDKNIGSGLGEHSLDSLSFLMRFRITGLDFACSPVVKTPFMQVPSLVRELRAYVQQVQQNKNVYTYAVLCSVAQSCPTLCDPTTVAARHLYPWGFSRILEWVAISCSRGSSQPRNRTRVSCTQADSLPTELRGKPSTLVLLSSIWSV